MLSTAGRSRKTPLALRGPGLVSSRIGAGRRKAIGDPLPLSRLVQEVQLLRAEVAELKRQRESTIAQPPQRAEQAVQALRDRLEHQGHLGSVPAASPTPEDSRQRFLIALTQDGSLVSAQRLINAWQMQRQALEQRVDKGQLFKLKIKNRNWYLGSMQVLLPDTVAAVCQAFGPVPAIDHLLFWLRRHGALQGKTVAEMLSAEGESGLKTVIALADAMAQQR